MANFQELISHLSLTFNTKSTDAQGILKPKSVIPREEGGLGVFNHHEGVDKTYNESVKHLKSKSIFQHICSLQVIIDKISIKVFYHL